MEHPAKRGGVTETDILTAALGIVYCELLGSERRYADGIEWSMLLHTAATIQSLYASGASATGPCRASDAVQVLSRHVEADTRPPYVTTSSALYSWCWFRYQIDASDVRRGLDSLQ